MGENCRPGIRVADPGSTEARALLAELDADLRARYPGVDFPLPDAVALVADGGVFLIAWLDDVPAGCGALKLRAPGTGEVKRMFVRAESRGQGVARAILDELEAAARARGCRRLLVETGWNQPEAIALYQRAGYRSIPCYGEYAGNAYSRCFEKPLMAP
jgi:GNAT superfamily N-acetyltransferase